MLLSARLRTIMPLLWERDAATLNFAKSVLICFLFPTAGRAAQRGEGQRSKVKGMLSLMRY